MSARSARDPAERLQFAQRTVDLAPSTRNLRLLAKLQAEKGNMSDALGAMQRAHDLDPNNLQTLTTLADIQNLAGEPDKALETYRKLIAVENTPYFKVRSLPEFVPTDTFYARTIVAAASSDPKERISYLQGAVDGYKQFLSLTVPNIIRFAQNSDGPLPYGGETLETAKKKLADAAGAAKALAAAYRVVGDAAKAEAADADVAVFGKPLDLPSAK